MIAPTFGIIAIDDEERASGRDDETAADARERDHADVLRVGRERHAAEERRNRRADAVVGNGAADAPAF
jgi:hypothetical protein